MKQLFFIPLFLISTYFFSQNYPMQNGTFTTCLGTFTDSGGNSNYGNNENFTITFCPIVPTDKIMLDFQNFNTQSNADIMEIFDGPDTSANSFGVFSGNQGAFVSTATPNNTSGCLTITFTSNASSTLNGWSAFVSCFTPCQTLLSNIDNTTPAINADGLLRICQGTDVQFSGSGTFSVDGTGAFYEWDFGDGATATGLNVSHVYPTPGVYIVNLTITDNNNCQNTNLNNLVVQVSTTPDFTGTGASEDPICLGETSDLTGVVTPVPFITDCTPPVSGQTFLPDGSGVSYSTCITVDCFASNQVITDQNQIVSVCLNVEHSYLGDLDIIIHSPNGQSCTLKAFSQGGNGTYLGGANDDGTLTPGIGVDYCFTPSATTYLVNGATVVAGSNPPHASIVSGNYRPFQSFTNLIGSPLNGQWCIEVIDNLSIDNGYIFEWSMDFDPLLLPADYSFTPIIVSEGWVANPDITATNGNIITVQPTTDGTHCYTYSATDDFGCIYTQDVCIEVDPLPVLNIPPDIEICDNLDDGDNQNGFVQLFDLDAQTPIIIGGQTGMSVTYYETFADADLETVTAQLGSPYSNIVAYYQTIYFRIENNATGCYTIGSFGIRVTDIPEINNPGTQTYCDNYAQSPDFNATNGIINALDFTGLNAGIINGQSGMAVTYYLSQTEAESGSNALIFPYQNTTPLNETIYIRLEEVNSGCFSVDSFSLVIHPLPNILNDSDVDGNVFNDFAITEYGLCEDLVIDGFTQFDLLSKETELLNGETGMHVSYFTTQAACLANTFALNPALPFINSTNPQTIYVRVENTTTGCVDYTQFQLRVYTNPVATTPADMEQCDDDTDGVMPFDLDSQTATIIGSQTGMVVSYHLTLADAQNDTNALSSPFSNNPLNSATQIFVRMENGISGCIDITDFWVIVHPLPIQYPFDDFELCDDNADGYMMFDLNYMTPIILNGQVGITLSYHYSLYEAQNNQAPITTPIQNTFANGQDEIFYHMENTVTGCDVYDSFFIRTLEIPFTNPVNDFGVCDDLVHDGFTEVYLDEMDAEIIAGQPGTSVYYYLTLADAQSGSNALPIPYTNATNPQMIYYGLVDDATGCVATGSFELEVLATMNISQPTPLEVCDPDSDGFHLFNLHLKDSEIAGALVGQVNVTYHETLTDAQLGITDIPDYAAYYNIDPWSQIIFVRVENITTGCFDTTTLELIVNPTPQINFTPDDMQVCDDNYNGFRQVDLTTHIPEILGSVPLADVQVTFYHSEAEAEAEVNMIVNDIAYTNTSNPETIWVRVEYPLTNCATIVSFDLVINPLPVLSTPDPLELCDNDDDGEDNNGFVQTFMLTDKDAEILDGQTGIVSYHYTQADAQSGSNPIASPFTNTFATVQTLWVRVQFIATGCFATTTLDVRVNPLPTPAIPQPVEACDNDDDGFASFDLDAALVFEIQNGEIGTDITFYETYQDALDDVNEISSPYTSISVADASQIIYARDTYTATGCFRIVEVLLIAQETPQPVDPEDYEVCDDNYDGFYGFDLTTKTDEILGDIDPATVIMTYHLSQADADSGSNAINIGSLYTNISNPQTIYVRVESVENGCFNTVSFDLIVNPIPVVIVPAAMELCDADPTDGIEMAYFNLESKVAEILNGQVGMIVYFYETLAQAEANNPNDWLVSPYANIENPQTIFVRLQNLNDPCYAITTMDLRVLPTPNANYTPAPLELCDNADDADATNGLVQTFDLNLATADIVNGQVGVSVAYYLSLAGAQNLYPSELIDLTVDFTNTTPFSQTVYAVVTDTLSPLSCSVIIPVELRVNPLPVLSNITDYLFCETDNNNIYLADLHEMDIHLLTNTTDLPNVTVTYHLTAVDAVTGSNPQPNPRILHDGDQLYAHVEFTATGCSSAVGPITITIEQEPRAVQPENLFDCDTAADGSNANGIGVSFDLASQIATILDGQTGMTVSFYESEEESHLEQNPISSPYLNTDNPQTIYVRVENDVTHCYNFTSFEIGVNDPPHFSMPAPPIVYCLFENPVYLQPLTDGDDYTYQWSNGTSVVGNTAILEVTAAGTYSLTLTTPEGCSETQSVTVDDSQESLLTVADLTITNFENNNSLTIPTGVQYGIGDYQYSVDGGPFTDQVFYENLNGGDHTLVIIDQNGCKTHTLHFTILDYMRFFTPNGDGYNDTWNLLGGNTQPGAKIYIFDRFGKLLASIDPAGEGWDGKFNGLPLPSTDYWFSIELEDGSIYKDHFALVRR
jgi:gliding motility-associated-like protein